MIYFVLLMIQQRIAHKNMIHYVPLPAVQCLPLSIYQMDLSHKVKATVPFSFVERPMLITSQSFLNKHLAHSLLTPETVSHQKPYSLHLLASNYRLTVYTFCTNVGRQYRSNSKYRLTFHQKPL